MKYLNKLSTEQIIDFFNENGLYVLDSLENEMLEIADNNSLYIKCYSSYSNENSIVKDIKSHLSNRMPIFYGGYDFCGDRLNIYELTDFTICRIFVDGEFNQYDYDLQRNYHKMMRNLFACSNYDSEFEAYLDTLEREK